VARAEQRFFRGVPKVQSSFRFDEEEEIQERYPVDAVVCSSSFFFLPPLAPSSLNLKRFFTYFHFPPPSSCQRVLPYPALFTGRPFTRQSWALSFQICSPQPGIRRIRFFGAVWADCVTSKHAVAVEAAAVQMERYLFANNKVGISVGQSRPCFRLQTRYD
jgi:hypothetical protein